MPTGRMKKDAKARGKVRGSARTSRELADPAEQIASLPIQVAKPGELPNTLLNEFEEVDWHRVNELIHEDLAVFLSVDAHTDEREYNWRVCIQRQVGRQNADVIFGERSDDHGVWIIPKRAMSSITLRCYEAIAVEVCGSCGDVR